MNKKIQVIRGISIGSVVMIHSNIGGVLAVIDRPFLNFSVAMFIFISGFLTKIEINNLLSFYKKRILRVIIPYIVWTIIYAVMYGSIHDLPKLLLTANASVQFYYVFVYLQFVLLTPIIGKMLRSRYRFIGFFITPVSLIFIRYLPVLMGIELGFPFPGTICLGWFIYYYLGMALGNDIINCRCGYKKGLILYGGAILIAVVEGIVWYICGNNDMATTQLRMSSVLTSVSAILIAYIYLIDEHIIVNKNMMNSLFLKLGDCSSGIYFAHIAVMVVISRIQVYSYLQFPIKSIIILCFSTVCVIIGRKLLGEKIGKYLGL